MAQGLIEVERKFIPGPGTEQRLQELGATLERRVIFRDTYYDTPELSLMRADHWLRQREDRGCASPGDSPRQADRVPPALPAPGL